MYGAVNLGGAGAGQYGFGGPGALGAGGMGQMAAGGIGGAMGGMGGAGMMGYQSGAAGGYGGVFKNAELSRIITELKKKETQEEAARKLHQYLAQYQEDCDDILFNQFRSMLQTST